MACVGSIVCMFHLFIISELGRFFFARRRPGASEAGREENNMRHVPVPLLSLVAAMVLAAPASAQQTAGAIVGAVQDPSGAVLPGVTVSMTGERVMGVQTTATDSRGSYRFRSVPPGTVDLLFELTGFVSLKRTQVRVELGATVEENVTLKLAAVNESVTVEASAAIIDTQTSKVESVFDKQFIDTAPIQRRSFI